MKEKKVNKLSFETLRFANVARVGQFTDAHGRRCHAQDGSDWTPSDWMLAVTGELGAAANEIKKVKRGDYALEGHRSVIAEELADAVIYLDLLAFRLGISLGDAVRAKFNRKSREKHLPVTLLPDDTWDPVVPSERDE